MGEGQHNPETKALVSAAYGHEIRVQSSDGLIRGTIDAAIRTDHGAASKTTRSGQIMESDGENDVKLKKLTKPNSRCTLLFMLSLMANGRRRLNWCHCQGNGRKWFLKQQNVQICSIKPKLPSKTSIQK